MATKTDIANFALGHIGDRRIADVDAPTNESGRVVKLWFDTSRRRVLRLANWNCCSKRVTLAKDPIAPIYGYANRYQLPGDFIRLVKVGESGGEGREHSIEGKYLLTNQGSPINIKYVFDQTDVSSFDEDLVQTLALMLGSNIASKLAQSNVKKRDLADAAELEAGKAKDVDTSGQAPQLIAGGSWISARAGVRDPSKWYG